MALWLGRQHCGLTLKELGQHVGADYPAVSKAILRMKSRLENDPAMRKALTQTEKAMSKVQTRPLYPAFTLPLSPPSAQPRIGQNDSDQSHSELG